MSVRHISVARNRVGFHPAGRRRTVARKGNRRVTLEISGVVNSAVILFEIGDALIKVGTARRAKVGGIYICGASRRYPGDNEGRQGLERRRPPSPPTGHAPRPFILLGPIVSLKPYQIRWIAHATTRAARQARRALPALGICNFSIGTADARRVLHFFERNGLDVGRKRLPEGIRTCRSGIQCSDPSPSIRGRACKMDFSHSAPWPSQGCWQSSTICFASPAR
jgi:hypothetical protein